MLIAEQKRLETHKGSKASKKTQVQGDTEGDATLIGSIMEAQLKAIIRLCMHKDETMRIESLNLIGLLLIQGLISPLICIPTLVALETDQCEYSERISPSFVENN